MGAPVGDTLIVNADDFGLCNGVNTGILSLLEQGRLNATSAMVTSPFFAPASSDLQSFTGKADIGLHFTLTQLETATSFANYDAAQTGGIGGVIKALCSRRLTCDAIAAELNAQLDLFEKHMGCAPAFIDGHHHIQQLPVIRTAILQTLVARYLTAATRPYIKCAFESPARVFMRGIMPARAFFIGFGGLGLRAQARAAGVCVNDSFAGIYDYSDRQTYRACFEQFIRAVKGNTVLMCHPGFDDDALEALGGFGIQRKAEYDFLAGGEFVDILARNGITAGRFVRPTA